MQIIRKHPGQPAEFAQIVDGSLKSLQAEVGGYIQAIPLFEGIILICNEEGKIMGLDDNFPVQFRVTDMICGNAIFVREDGSDFGSVAEGDIEKLCNYLGFWEMGLPTDV